MACRAQGKSQRNSLTCGQLPSPGPRSSGCPAGKEELAASCGRGGSQQGRKPQGSRNVAMESAANAAARAEARQERAAHRGAKGALRRLHGRGAEPQALGLLLGLRRRRQRQHALELLRRGEGKAAGSMGTQSSQAGRPAGALTSGQGGTSRTRSCPRGGTRRHAHRALPPLGAAGKFAGGAGVGEARPGHQAAGVWEGGGVAAGGEQELRHLGVVSHDGHQHGVQLELLACAGYRHPHAPAGTGSGVLGEQLVLSPAVPGRHVEHESARHFARYRKQVESSTAQECTPALLTVRQRA